MQQGLECLAVGVEKLENVWGGTAFRKYLSALTTYLHYEKYYSEVNSLLPLMSVWKELKQERFKNPSTGQLNPITKQIRVFR